MAVTLVVGVYFYKQLKRQKQSEPSVRRESGRELERLQALRAIHLS